MPTLNRSRRAAGELFGHRVVSGDDLDDGGSVGPRPSGRSPPSTTLRATQELHAEVGVARKRFWVL